VRCPDESVKVAVWPYIWIAFMALGFSYANPAISTGSLTRGQALAVGKKL
jgi:hypothetical protein